ncbi:putative short-subunit dehydrogenase-like oxidoreductase (DUF2520 family) [Desulfitispora alkaliphila]|uniref:Rossmann-like and DUF2520 domain-containing protein n=1 Tax=Desulfitispora alkaliphila TaxID=622674 RepID=UPI003D1956DB
MKLGIVGAGRVGSALAKLLSIKGYQVVAVASRSKNKAEKLAGEVGAEVMDNDQVVVAADLTVLSVSDDAIEAVANEISLKLNKDYRRSKGVIHCSGVHSCHVLKSLEAKGLATASFHPLQSFATAEQAVRMIGGAVFTLEGDKELIETKLKTLVNHLEGKLQVIETEHKVLYHAAAVVASNYLVALTQVSCEMMERSGFTREMALEALLPLIKGSVSNIEKLGVPKSLTGPIARGDITTVQRHCSAIEETMPQYDILYRDLGKVAVQLTEQRGDLSSELALNLTQLLSKNDVKVGVVSEDN